MCRVEFPEILDLTAFTTSGQLSMAPTVPISSPSNRSLTPTPQNSNPPRTFYQLSAVVCHYGQHSFGHYICYRRKPRPPSAGASRFSPPKLACPWGCECERCLRSGHIRVDDEYDVRRKYGHGWLRISDENVQECGIETVLQESSAAFMLFYERVLQPRPSQNPFNQIPRGSEETVRPRDVQGQDSSSTWVEVEVENKNTVVRPPSAQGKLVKPRVVRSVSAASRSRSPPVNSATRPRPLPVPPPAVNGSTKPHANGHISNGFVDSIPTLAGSSAHTSWYYPGQVDSRVSSHPSKNVSHQRGHQPSNSLQYHQPQHITT